MRDQSFFLVTTFALGVAAAASMLLPVARVAAEEGGYFLPLALAQKAANASIASCAGSGYAVSAAIVDTSAQASSNSKPRATTQPCTRPHRPFARLTRW